MLKEAAQDARLISSTDRLLTTLFFAVLAHGVVILGISFSAEDPQRGGQTLDVTLVPEGERVPPEKADYLANANQSGGGNTTERVRPSTATAGNNSVNNPGRQDGTAQRNDTQTGQSVSALLRTIAQSRQQVASEPQQAQTRPPLIAQLAIAGAARAQPLDIPQNKTQAYSDEPTEKYIAVNTKAALYAEYMTAWRDKVQRLGNVHYPDAARRESLSGTVRLEVALNADGTIHELIIRIPSRYKLLDQAAQRIVQLGAPYAPFPAEVSKTTDILRFVYDWQFVDGKQAQGKVGMPSN